MIKMLCNLATYKYAEEQYSDLVKLEGKAAVDKNELLEMINELDSRGNAICLVNLITASRPNEMIRMKIKDFNFENRSIAIYLKKQKKWFHKRLNQKT